MSIGTGRSGTFLNAGPSQSRSRIRSGVSPLTTCRICGREIAVRDELGWAVVQVREAVKLSPPEFVPQEFLVHLECAKTKPLLADERCRPLSVPAPPGSLARVTFANAGPREASIACDSAIPFDMAEAGS